MYSSIKQHCFLPLRFLLYSYSIKRLCIHVFCAARSYTSAYVNPSLAYGLTFFCSGFTWAEYALVYWLGPFTGR